MDWFAISGLMSVRLYHVAPEAVPFDPAEAFDFQDLQDVDNGPGNLRQEWKENITISKRKNQNGVFYQS